MFNNNIQYTPYSLNIVFAIVQYFPVILVNLFFYFFNIFSFSNLLSFCSFFKICIECAFFFLHAFCKPLVVELNIFAFCCIILLNILLEAATQVTPAEGVTRIGWGPDGIFETFRLKAQQLVAQCFNIRKKGFHSCVEIDEVQHISNHSDLSSWLKI